MTMGQFFITFNMLCTNHPWLGKATILKNVIFQNPPKSITGVIDFVGASMCQSTFTLRAKVSLRIYGD